MEPSASPAHVLDSLSDAGGGLGKALQGKELINPKPTSLDRFDSEMTTLIQEDLLIL